MRGEGVGGAPGRRHWGRGRPRARDRCDPAPRGAL